VKAAALAEGIKVTERVDDVMDAGVDIGVVVAFGRLIKPHVLERVPMVNLHFSLLPRWRGAAPVERAILAGDAETGVCLMAVEAGLDTGPVYRCERVSIAPDETADELRARLVTVGTRILVEELDRGLGRPTPQEGDATYAAKLEPEDLRLDWSRPADELHRVVRLGRAWTTFRGRRLRVLRAGLTEHGPPPGLLDGPVVGTGDGRGLVLEEVQAEGRGATPAADWLRGARPEAGERLGA
jgi:methionyl-tRNA formyltransferase